MAAGTDDILRRFARDQWVRLHGTPRITVLAGERARSLYASWSALSPLPSELIDGGDFDAAIRGAYARAIAQPKTPIAVAATSDQINRWRAGRADRLAAMVDEGLIFVGESIPQLHLDARSAAEAALFEALEATPATTGIFELNASLSVRFGPVACEVDLLCRSAGIAVEIDGYHHFTDGDGYRRDRRKDLLMQMQELIVVRVLAEDVMRDPRDAIRMVCEALAYRRARP